MRQAVLVVPLFTLLALLAIAAPLAACGDTNRDEARLQEGLDELRDLGITGVIGALDVDGERFVAGSGVGSIETEEPVAVDGYFRMGSNTKTFVSTVVLQLVGEGELSLDDTVDSWLPGIVTGNGNDGQQITVRQLLQHTTGLFNYTDELIGMYGTLEALLEHRADHYEDDELLAFALQHEPLFAPGAAWSYSNTNYIVAGMIIEKITGHDWAFEVDARVIEPLGLDHTFDPGDEPDLPSPHANGYEQVSDGSPLVDVTLFNQTWAGAAGSLVTTTADLVRFWQATARGELLAPTQLAQLKDTVLADAFQSIWPGSRYGLGIIWYPSRCGGYWSHGGDTLGFATRNAVTEDGSRTVVVSLSTELGVPATLDVLEQVDQLLEDLTCGDG